MNNLNKTIKNSILTGTLCTVMLCNATEISSSVLKDDNGKTAITLNNVKVGNLLSIKDFNGTTLYTESIKTSGMYRKGFDLTSLPNGDYFFEVEKDLEIKTIPFMVSRKKVFFGDETTTFKPYIKQKGDVIYISKFAPNLEALTISIYADNNSGYELLYTDRIKGLQSIEKAYKLNKGNYKIVFSSDNKEFTKFINN
jgi:hypothetical protein